MKIVLVLDQFDNENNGTTISAARFAENLRGRGHEVVVISTGKPRENKFVVPSGHLGILQPLVDNQGTVFAKPDDAVIRRALGGADIVHLYLPYKLCMRTREIAAKSGAVVIDNTSAFRMDADTPCEIDEAKQEIPTLLDKWKQ